MEVSIKEKNGTFHKMTIKKRQRKNNLIHEGTIYFFKIGFSVLRIESA